MPRAAAAKQTIIVATNVLHAVHDPNSLLGGSSMPEWSLVYETLVDGSLPPDLASAKKAANQLYFKPPPLAAQSVTSISSGRRWRFTMRANARSGYGNLLTAEDVVWSFHRALATKQNTNNFLRLAGITDPGQVRAHDKQTVELVFASAPPPYFLTLMGAPWMQIYDSTEVQSHTSSADPWGVQWLASNMAGFGPYRLLEAARDGSRTVLEVNPGYWGRKQRNFTPQIIFSTVPDDSSRLELVLSGSADIADNLSALQLNEVKKSKIATVEQIATGGGVFLGMDNTAAPFNYPSLRQGIAQAIPYKDILNTVYLGYAKPWKTMLSPYMQGATSQFWKWDTNPAAAKKALAPVAGATIKLTYEAGNATQQQIALLVAQGLTAAGLNASADGPPQPTVRAKRLAGQLPFWVDPYDTPGLPNSFYVLKQLYAPPPVQTILHYTDNRLAPVFAAGVKATNPKARLAALQNAQRILVNDMPMIPIAWTGQNLGVSKSLTGFRSITLSQLWLRTLTAKS